MAVNNENEASRREFLRLSGGALGMAWLGTQWPAIAAAATHAHGMMEATPPARTIRLLTPDQARDVAAIAAQIVPSGATPGATEAGVVYFIDHVFGGAFAPRAGDFFAGLEGFAADFAKGHPTGIRFADLAPEEQTAYLRSIEATPFFGAMRMLTIAGLLSLPSYGGNRDQVGWKLVGFNDGHIWEPPFGAYDRGYAGFVPYRSGSNEGSKS
jgi:gluconate 2-dehydrogenase gamma chain